MADRESWPLLGQMFTAAQRRARERTERLADQLARVDVPAAQQNMARTYVEGRSTGWEVYSSDLGTPVAISGSVLRDWVDEAEEKSERLLKRLVATLETRDEVTRAFIGDYAASVSTNVLWQGIDASGFDVARLAEAEWKTWVRSWQRVRQRDWHSTLEGVTVPIEDLFTLPGGPNIGAKVDGPRDWEAVNDPREHMNCGHALRFTREATAGDLAGTLSAGNVVYEPPTVIAPAVQAQAAAAGSASPYETAMARVKASAQRFEELNRAKQQADQASAAFAAAFKAYDEARSLPDKFSDADVQRLFLEYDTAARAEEKAVFAYRDLSEALKDAVHESLREMRTVDENKVSSVVFVNTAARNGLSIKVHGVDSWVGIDRRQGSRLVANHQEATAWYLTTMSAASLDVATMDVAAYEPRHGQRVRAAHVRDEGIFLSKESATGTVVHELAHAIERQNPTVHRATLRFLQSRTANDKTRPLNDLAAERGLTNRYGPREVARADAFFVPYVGRIYRSSYEPLRGGYVPQSTEVLAMGMERMFDDPVGFFQEDEGHFELIAAILTGTLEDSPYYVDDSVEFQDLSVGQADLPPKTRR